MVAFFSQVCRQEFAEKPVVIHNEYLLFHNLP
jgi:hypothetical protein